MGKVARTVIPNTIEGVEGLLVARKWDKAAIVYAWTEPDDKASAGRKGGHAKASSTAKNSRARSLYTIAEFANLGIAGLTNRHTVAAYRDAWFRAISKNLADEVKPGDEINLDLLFEEKFPATGNAAYPKSDYGAEYVIAAHEAGVSTDAARRAGSNKAALEAAIKADPEVERAVLNALNAKAQQRAGQRHNRVTDKMGPPIPVPEIPRPAWESNPMNTAMEGMIDEGNRRDRIHELQGLAAAIKTRAEALVADHSHTGVPEEVEWLHEITHNLSEAQWALTGFIVETENAK